MKRSKIKRLGNERGWFIWGGVFILVVVGFFSLFYIVAPSILALNYKSEKLEAAVGESVALKELPVVHLQTPEPLKAIYMSSWVAGTPSIREGLVKLVEETELNAIVIDIKDYTGKIAFEVLDPDLQKIGSAENRVPDMKDFIAELHKKNIYVIGRIAVFQDPYMVKNRPDLAVKKKSDGAVWKDYKGITWLDAGSREVWDYAILIGRESYALGFDELNFDYIRFPSDGNMKDISYPLSGVKPKPEVIRDFFEYLSANLRPSGVKISADLFGMTATNKDDLNIGQVLENALPYFDYIAPMVYPSHYPPGFNGYNNPNKHSYEVVHFSMSEAAKRTLAASTTPLKLRPWLQDFDYGGDYDVPEVRAQIKATYDSGLTSWMLWSPSNKYTKGALQSE